MKTYLIDEKKSYELARRAFSAMGYNDEDSDNAAKVISMADARGVDTHGLARVEMYYGIWKLPGCVNHDAKFKVIKETPVSAYVDADFGLGPVMAPKAMDICVKKAKESGIGIVSVKNSGHFSMAGYYSIQAAKNDLIGLVASNTLSAMAPFGGTESIIGNSPWTLAFPKGNKYNDYVMLDMSCANASFGKLQAKVRANEEMPLGWGIDHDGNPTTDPNDVLLPERGGALIAFGGVKGSCLAIMMEFLSAVLSGSGYAPDSGTGDYLYGVEVGRKENLGHFMMAIDPTILRPIEDLRADIDRYADMVHNSRPRTGSPQVYLPGELEAIQSHKREAEGINVPEPVMSSLLNVYHGLGLVAEDGGIEDMLAL